MEEIWDVYDENKRKTGETMKRVPYVYTPGKYNLIVTATILNSKNEILISKRAENKKFGLMWELPGGAVRAGETSLEGILREVKEEIGIKFTKKEAILLKELKREKDFKDIWLFKREVKDEEIKFADGEVIDTKWVSIEEFLKMFEEKQIVPGVNFVLEDYNKALQLQRREAYNYIGKKLEVQIDRPLNTKHPKHGFVYELNYGYVPNTISGDGEELDCYILGVEEPVQSYEGECIAVIHRTNDDDDKLIIVPEGKNYTDEEIRRLTHFQEQYFESEIIK